MAAGLALISSSNIRGEEVVVDEAITTPSSLHLQPNERGVSAATSARHSRQLTALDTVAGSGSLLLLPAVESGASEFCFCGLLASNRFESCGEADRKEDSPGLKLGTKKPRSLTRDIPARSVRRQQAVRGLRPSKSGAEG